MEWESEEGLEWDILEGSEFIIKVLLDFKLIDNAVDD